MPDDDLDRDLSDGKVYVWGESMNRRSRQHAYASSRITHFLIDWLDSQTEPRGEILVGDAAFRLRKDSPDVVCADVAYISAEMSLKNDEQASIMEGIPTLIVEITSPSDTSKKVAAKVNNYLSSGVPLIWVIEPALRTITIYRPDAARRYLANIRRLKTNPTCRDSY